MSWKHRRRKVRYTAELRLTADPPVVIIRSANPPPTFQYSVSQWVRIVGAPRLRRGWPDSVNLGQMMLELEAAAQEYLTTIAATRAAAEIDYRHRARTALIHAAIRIWARAIGTIKISRFDGIPAGPLLRYLEAVLDPVLGEDRIGLEALVKIIRAKEFYGSRTSLL